MLEINSARDAQRELLDHSGVMLGAGASLQLLEALLTDPPAGIDNLPEGVGYLCGVLGRELATHGGALSDFATR